MSIGNEDVLVAREVYAQSSLVSVRIAALRQLEVL